jgi:hypothetical protein
MIDHLWHDRVDMADLMIALKAGAEFVVACRMETMRRHAIAWARGARDFIRRAR